MKIFDEETYYKRIKILEFLNYIKTLAIIIMFIISATIINEYFVKKELIIAIIIGLTISLIIAYISYYNKQQKIEEMKMKLDIYHIIEKIEEKNK